MVSKNKNINRFIVFWVCLFVLFLGLGFGLGLLYLGFKSRRDGFKEAESPQKIPKTIWTFWDNSNDLKDDDETNETENETENEIQLSTNGFNK